MSIKSGPYWREHGVRVISGDNLDANTPQTPGMTRAAAVNYAKAGDHKLWAGTAQIKPKARTGAHHHGELESIIYVVSGWNIRPKQGPAILYSYRPLCPSKKLTPATTNLSIVCWLAATRSPLL